MKLNTLQFKKVMAAALFVLLLGAAEVLNAQNFTVGDLNYYVFDGTNVQVNGHVNGTAATGPLTIPETVTYNGTTYTVTKIRYSAFDSCSGLTGSLTIPNSVTIIDNGAFRNCSGFTGTLTLPNNLTKITASVFYGCSGFTGSLIIPNTVTEIWSSAFAGCSGFTGSLVIPNNVESIDWAAFQGCSGFNGPLTIPNSVEVIYYHAFENCTGLTGDLNIPNSVTTIEEYAFAGCSGFDGSLTISNNVTSIRSNAFSGCSGLTGSLVIPDNVTSIGSNAFSGCSGLTGSLVIPDNVTSIGSNAFSGCSSLSGPLVIPDNVTSIGGNAFSGCSSFSDTLSLGASLTGIGNNAFFGACGNFTALNVWAEVPPTLGTEAFTSIDYSIPLSIPNGTCNAYQNASGWDAFVNINMLEPDQGFEITATANPAEAGTIKGICRFSQGQTCTLTATPNSGYVFTNWTENGEVVSTNIVYSFTVEGDRDLEANFVVADIHSLVDLGLPSGTLWATCNLGTDSPEGYGNTFTWDEAQPDAAMGLWGGDWRMPTSAELQELIDNTSFTWFNWNGINNPAFGVYGALFTAPNGNSIFLRANHIWTELYNGGIWASDEWVLGYGLDNGDPYHYVEDLSEFSSSISCPIRPVRATPPPTHIINAPANPAEFGVVTGGGSYFEGSECTLTATPNEGCVFAYWKENDAVISFNPTYSFMVTEDRDLVACFFNPDVHTYVDLGLPSGTLWATCNLGAAHPAEGGKSFNWGGPQPTAQGYFWRLYYYCYEMTTNGFKLTKYCNNPDYGVNDFTDNLTTLLPEDDLATINWGIDWRTPTLEEWEELIQNTTYSWVVLPGGELGGALFTASNGNSIFLPGVNGYFEHFMTWYDSDGPCHYWSSSLDTVNSLQAYSFSGTPTSYEVDSHNRSNGLSVRPVRSSLQNVSYTITATAHPEEGGLITGAGDYIIGDTCTLTALPNGNYVFANWKENGEVVSTDATYSFMVTRDRSLVAHFVNPDAHSFVDLGLPSGTLWANCNVGANSPEENGDYFAWGETLPKNKYGWDTYSHCDFYAMSGDFYISKYMFFPDTLTTLVPIDDAATNNLGNDSRIPTQEEWQELMDNCTSVWTTQNGVEGTCFTGPNGNSIFLPGAGTNLIHYGRGYYWSSSLTYYYNNFNLPICWRAAWKFSTAPEGCSLDSDMPRAQGCSVRAVYTEPITYDINANANMAEGGIVTGSGTYGYGQTCTLSATANDGYSFLYWTSTTGEILSTDADYSFTVTEDVDFVAYFYEGLACDITFALYNPWGDSWWGEYIMVTDENGTSKRMTLESGFSATYTITFGHGSHPVLAWSGGLNCSFAVSYTFDGTVIYEGMNDYGGSYEFEVDCSGAFPTYYSVTATANPADGGMVSGADTYTEGSTCTLTATANDGYSFINWTQDGEEVSTNETYSFTVTEDAAFVANFSLNTYNITVVANPVDGGMVSGTGTYDHGATVTLSAMPNDGYRFASWTKNGMTVSTSANYSFTVTEGATFVANFRIYNPSQDIIQTSDLLQGWNWWNTYINMDGYNSLAMLEEALGTNAMQIKSQSDFAQYLEISGYGGYWYGTLDTILSNKKTYLIQTSSACQAEIIGAPVSPADHPITILPGWNWIGFPSSTAISFAEAFAGFTPTDGDQVKSQSGFSQYMFVPGYGGVWYGGLETENLTPGIGLMYKSMNTENATLVYPNAGRSVENVSYVEKHWTNDVHAYPGNMTLMAVVELDDVELASDNYELAAFADGECRGSAKLTYVEPLNRHFAFLTIAGDEATELYFGLYNHSTGEESFESGDILVYTTDASVGSFNTPMVVRFRGTTGSDEWANNLKVYPNPVARGQRFSIGLDDVTSQLVRVEIVNALGVIISVETSTKMPASIVAPNTAGIYMLKITAEGKCVLVRRLIVR